MRAEIRCARGHLRSVRALLRCLRAEIGSVRAEIGSVVAQIRFVRATPTKKMHSIHLKTYLFGLNRLNTNMDPGRLDTNTYTKT